MHGAAAGGSRGNATGAERVESHQYERGDVAAAFASARSSSSASTARRGCTRATWSRRCAPRPSTRSATWSSTPAPRRCSARATGRAGARQARSPGPSARDARWRRLRRQVRPDRAAGRRVAVPSIGRCCWATRASRISRRRPGARERASGSRRAQGDGTLPRWKATSSSTRAPSRARRPASRRS